MGHDAPPAPPLRKAAGPIGWALGIVTGVAFIAMLYGSAGHDEGGHGEGHGGDHAPAAEAKADGAGEH